MPSQEIVEIVVGGQHYRGWKSMSVSMNAKSPERTFQIVGALANPPIAAAALAINPNDPCIVTANGSPLVIGRVHDVEITLSPDNHEIRITGKSRGADAVKSSVDHKTHEWKNKTILQIAQDVDSSGIGYTTDENLTPVPKWRANVGATQMKMLGHLADKQRLFLCGSANGGIIITKHGKHRHGGGIIEGVNFKSGQAKFSSEDRAGEVIVKGHRHKGTGTQNTRYEHRETDPGGRPGTKKVIVPKVDMTKQEAKETAQHAVDNRFGDSVQLSCELQGFRDIGGMVWQPGWLVWCEVPSCRLSMELAISTISLHQDELSQGSIAKLTLVHPAALGGKGGKGGGKSGGGWKAPK
jgi:prophage tail gpP-like protein